MANGKALVKAPVSTLEVLMAVLEKPGLEITKMHDILDFQIRFEAREAEKAFYADYALANEEMPRITKDGIIPRKGDIKIPFAKYETLDKIIKPIEQKYGFTRMFVSQPSPNGITMVLILAHRDGHSIRSERWHPPEPAPGCNTLQGLGAAGAYAKRYLTTDIWNIVTIGADDDGVSADCISKEQVKTIYGLLKDLNIIDPSPRFGKFLVYAAAKSVELIQKQNYESVMARLRTAHTKEVDL